jgi:hypothetical protein
VDKHRTGGMTAIAVLNIIIGAIVILAGLFQLLFALTLTYELLRLGAFELPAMRFMFAFLILATGIVGLIAGIGMLSLRPSARGLSLVFAGLLIVSAALSYFLIPIIASIGTYDLASISAEGLVRLIIFCVVYVVLPVSYALILFVVLNTRAWTKCNARAVYIAPGRRPFTETDVTTPSRR